jgi:hypothetical protein
MLGVVSSKYFMYSEARKRNGNLLFNTQRRKFLALPRPWRTISKRSFHIALKTVSRLLFNTREKHQRIKGQPTKRNKEKRKLKKKWKKRDKYINDGRYIKFSKIQHQMHANEGTTTAKRDISTRTIVKTRLYKKESYLVDQ